MEKKQRAVGNLKEEVERNEKSNLLKVILIFVIVIGSIASYFLLEKTFSLIDARTEGVVKGTSGWFNEQIACVETIVTTIEDLKLYSDGLDDCQNYLADCIGNNASVYDYYLCLADQTCVFGGGWEPAPGEYDATTRTWYQKAKESGKLYISEAYVDADSGKMVVTISKPVYDAGQFVGVFAADFFLTEMENMAENLSTRNSFAILVDSNGTVLVHRNEKYLPSTDANGNEILTNYKDAGIAESLFMPKERIQKTTLSFVYRAEYIEEAGMTVIFATSFISFYFALICFYVFCLLLAICSIIGSRKRTRVTLNNIFSPLQELKHVADNMSNCLLTYDASYTMQDEIGELCLAIEKSNASIKSYIKDIDEKLAMMAQGDFTVDVDMDYIGDFTSVKDSINEILKSLRFTLQAIAEVSDNVYGSAQNVSSEAGSLAENVESVSSLVTDVNDDVTDMQAKFEENLAVAEESMQLSNDAKNYLEESNGQIRELAFAMEEITDRSNKIAEIIEIINGIATQTNLLALNASIEAARAGEAGKGFAVVAESVRELAEQTASAADNTTRLIEESLRAVETGNSLVEKTTKKMQQVVDITEDVNGHIEGIASSIREETNLVESVSEDMHKMEQVAENTASSSEECVALSKELFEQVALMKEHISEFKL